MITDIVAEFFTALGFEEVEIEDNLTALGIDTDSEENYLLLTDEEGKIPETLKQRIVLAYYSADGAYQWSAGFKNAYVFKEVWMASVNLADRLSAMQEYRTDQIK